MVCSTWHINIRILHSGSKAQYMGVTLPLTAIPRLYPRPLDMGVVKNKGALIQTPNGRALIRKTPTRGTPNLGNSNAVPWWDRGLHQLWAEIESPPAPGTGQELRNFPGDCRAARQHVPCLKRGHGIVSKNPQDDVGNYARLLTCIHIHMYIYIYMYV